MDVLLSGGGYGVRLDCGMGMGENLIASLDQDIRMGIGMIAYNVANMFSSCYLEIIS